MQFVYPVSANEFDSQVYICPVLTNKYEQEYELSVCLKPARESNCELSTCPVSRVCLISLSVQSQSIMLS